MLWQNCELVCQNLLYYDCSSCATAPLHCCWARCWWHKCFHLHPRLWTNASNSCWSYLLGSWPHQGNSLPVALSHIWTSWSSVEWSCASTRSRRMKPCIALSSPGDWRWYIWCRTNTHRCTSWARLPLRSLLWWWLPTSWTSCLLDGLLGLVPLPHAPVATFADKPAISHVFVAACLFTIVMSAAALSTRISTLGRHESSFLSTKLVAPRPYLPPPGVQQP